MYYIVSDNPLRKSNKYGGFIKCSVCGKEQQMIWSRCEYKDNEGYVCKYPIKCKCGHVDTLILNQKSDIDNEYIPHCPTCGSPNIHKISATNKVGSAVVFGVFSIGHVGKTYKCDNCGVEW